MASVFNPGVGPVQVDSDGHVLAGLETREDVDPTDPITAAAVLGGSLVIVDRRYVDNARPVPDTTAPAVDASTVPAIDAPPEV